MLEFSFTFHKFGFGSELQGVSFYFERFQIEILCNELSEEKSRSSTTCSKL